VIKFVSDLGQSGGFLHDITEILLKVALNTINPLYLDILYYNHLVQGPRKWCIFHIENLIIYDHWHIFHYCISINYSTFLE